MRKFGGGGMMDNVHFLNCDGFTVLPCFAKFWLAKYTLQVCLLYADYNSIKL